MYARCRARPSSLSQRAVPDRLVCRKLVSRSRPARRHKDTVDMGTRASSLQPPVDARPTSSMQNKFAWMLSKEFPIGILVFRMTVNSKAHGQSAHSACAMLSPHLPLPLPYSFPLHLLIFPPPPPPSAPWQRAHGPRRDGAGSVAAERHGGRVARHGGVRRGRGGSGGAGRSERRVLAAPCFLLPLPPSSSSSRI